MRGLPELPDADLGDTLLREHPDAVHREPGPCGGRRRCHGGVHDRQSEPDQAWVTDSHRGVRLPHHVGPRIGLREDDFRVLADLGRRHGTEPGR